MSLFIAFTVAGIATYGCVYALAAMGLVVTYTTSGVFNFAQGALGMMGAFTYWQLTVAWGWPTLPSFLLVAFVLGPASGALIERYLMRRVANSKLEAKITVTVGLLLFLIAVAQWRWSPQVSRAVPQFFNGRSVTIGSVVLSYHQLIIIAVAIAMAAGMRVFLYASRAGIATRAVVDDRVLTGMSGAPASRYSMVGWAIGSCMACIAGILLAPSATLDITILTLVVINGYAAATVGRLKSLPLTFAGAIVLGLLQSYAAGYARSSSWIGRLTPGIPMLFMLLAMLVLPQRRAALTRELRVRAPRIASLRESVVASSLFVLIAMAIATQWSGSTLAIACRGVAVAIIMLSLVLLTGYGGQVSLCQLTLAGFGAFGMEKVGGTSGSLLGLLAGAGLAAALGAVIALPALRLRGLYLALSTLAFAYGLDSVFFGNSSFVGTDLAIRVARPDIPGVDLTSNFRYFVVLCLVFAVAGVAVLAVRRSAFGRRLLAMNDSPAAATTVGVNLTATKLAVFVLSSALAGLGGALYAGTQGIVGRGDFAFLTSATLLMLVVVWGVRTIGGVLISGIIFAFGPRLQDWVGSQWSGAPTNLLQITVGMAAIGIATNPEGVFGAKTPLDALRARRARQLERAVGMNAVSSAV